MNKYINHSINALYTSECGSVSIVAQPNQLSLFYQIPFNITWYYCISRNKCVYSIRTSTVAKTCTNTFTNTFANTYLYEHTHTLVACEHWTAAVACLRIPKRTSLQLPLRTCSRTHAWMLTCQQYMKSRKYQIYKNEINNNELYRKSKINE